MKKQYDIYINDVLKLLFLHFDSISNNTTRFTLEDLACYLFNEEVDLAKYPLSQENLKRYI